MEFRIKETKEIKNLAIRDKNGIEWTNDLLGNYDALQYNQDTEEYEISQEYYEWWKEYIKNYKADENEIQELAEELGIEEYKIWEKINQELDCDLENEHYIKQNIIQKIKDGVEL